MAKTMKSLFLIFIFGFLLLNVTNHSFAQSEQVVILETTSGNIVIEFFPEDAPKTVDNFLNLAESGFYDGIIFHRIIKDFMIQGGDPLSKDPESKSLWGTSGSEKKIEAEFNTIKHNRGIVSMARTTDPNSATSQFFIVHKNSNDLDEKYTVFGRIITQESLDTLDKIASLNTTRNIPDDTEQAKILTAKVVQRSEISDLLELDEPERVLSSASVDEITQEEGGGCLIATATFGSELAPQVQQLRELRDEIVLQTESGTAFMKQFNQFYYLFSPTIADLERENSLFKEAVKVTITPLLTTLSILNYVDIDSEQEMLGYGIGIILMNIGMYFVAPAIVIHRLRK